MADGASRGWDIRLVTLSGARYLLSLAHRGLPRPPQEALPWNLVHATAASRSLTQVAGPGRRRAATRSLTATSTAPPSGMSPRGRRVLLLQPTRCRSRAGGTPATASVSSADRRIGVPSGPERRQASSRRPLRATSSASLASPRIHQIIARAASGSAHHQPRIRLRSKPTSSVADM